MPTFVRSGLPGPNPASFNSAVAAAGSWTSLNDGFPCQVLEGGTSPAPSIISPPSNSFSPARSVARLAALAHPYVAPRRAFDHRHVPGPVMRIGRGDGREPRGLERRHGVGRRCLDHVHLARADGGHAGIGLRHRQQQELTAFRHPGGVPVIGVLQQHRTLAHDEGLELPRPGPDRLGEVGVPVAARGLPCAAMRDADPGGRHRGTVLSTMAVSSQNLPGPSAPQATRVGMRRPTWAEARGSKAGSPRLKARSKENTMASASSSLPSWNFTLGRRVNSPALRVGRVGGPLGRQARRQHRRGTSPLRQVPFHQLIVERDAHEALPLRTLVRTAIGQRHGRCRHADPQDASGCLGTGPGPMAGWRRTGAAAALRSRARRE